MSEYDDTSDLPPYPRSKKTGGENERGVAMLSIEKIASNSKIPSILRQVARNICESTYSSAGLILNQLCFDDLAWLEREWILCITRSRENQSDMTKEKWFNHLLLLADMLYQAENSELPMGAQANPGIQTSLVTILITLVKSARSGLIKIPDFRKLSITLENFQDFTKFGIETTDQDGSEDIYNAMKDAADLLGLMMKKEHVLKGAKSEEEREAAMRELEEGVRQLGKQDGRLGVTIQNSRGEVMAKDLEGEISYGRDEGKPRTGPGTKSLEDRLNGLLGN